jgi:hypothetical protein
VQQSKKRKGVSVVIREIEKERVLERGRERE